MNNYFLQLKKDIPNDIGWIRRILSYAFDWFNYDDYFVNAYVKEGEEDKIEKPKVLEYNRYNYGMNYSIYSSKGAYASRL